MKKCILLFSLLGCALLAAPSCQKELTPDAGTLSRNVQFNISTESYQNELPTKGDYSARVASEGGPMLYISSVEAAMGSTPTKSAPVTSLYDDKFGLFGYQFDASSSFTGTELPTLCYNTEVKKLQENVWTSTSQTLYYPGASYKIRLYAYSPYNGGGVTVASSSTAPGAPVLSFQQNASIASQIDLLESQSEDISGDNDGTIDLTFSHALAGIKVKFASFGTEVTVKSVSFKNLFSSGNHALGSDSWTNQGNKTTWSVTEDLIVPASGDSQTLSEENTVLVVPQTCDTDAEMEIILTFDGVEHKYRAALSGVELKKGFITTFTLSLNDADILAEVAEGSTLTAFANTTSSASQTLTVKSFALYKNGLKAPASWEMEYSEDGTTWSSTKPSWITLSKTSGTGSITGEAVTVTAASRSLRAGELDAESQARNATLQSRSAIGSSGSPIDLSMMDYQGNTAASRSTANCYVVHRAGYYTFPLAYGNAVKNGVTNTEAFYTTVARKFVNADGVRFTGSSRPYLEDDTYTMEVLWNDLDVPFSLNASSTTKNGVPYATFSIPQSGIKEGNILIAAKKDGVIKWSWHIWVSGADFTPEVITNESGVNFSIMPIDLGWCGAIASGYPARTCYLRVKTSSNASPAIAVQQNFVAGDEAPTYAVTYYQWGRKDPFIGMGIAPTDGGKVSYAATSDGSVATAHQNPTTHYDNRSYGVTNESNRKTWFWDSKCSSNNVDQKATKTIYDPCPVGWVVPQYSTFTGFSTTNVVGSFDKGWYFKRNSSDEEGLYFPVYGQRFCNSASLSDVGSRSYRWLSVPYSGNGGSYYGDAITISSSYVGPQRYNNLSSGSGVRPALDN